ncbi:MAG: cysteine desulfurase [Pseudomonadota bacterium]
MSALPSQTDAVLDVERVRADFPVLSRLVHGRPLAYLDNANTAQRPRAVIDAVVSYYTEHNANVARAVHALGAEATALYEGARDKLARLVNAASRDEIVFTSGTTMAINLVAYAWAMPRLRQGDAIVVTTMEHHANIVPWQIACERTGATLKVAPISPAGELLLDELFALLTPEVRLLALTHVSNALGTVNPVAVIAAEARRRGIPVLVDGSQAVPHMAVDVQALGVDFYAFTGHKMFGPTGTGVLWARGAILESMPPFLGGGEMIRTVRFERSTWADPPHRFEAGTPNIAGFIGLGAAVDYIGSLGIERIAARERDLLAHAHARLAEVPGLRILGTVPGKAPVVSFLVEGAHAHDLATLVDAEGVAVRSGHHCAHPLMQFYGVAATARASLAVYNTHAEIDRLADALQRARRMLA